jgi:hypothetical protein
MSSNLIFGSIVNMQLAATPSSGSYLVAYDVDGFIKQKDDNGIVTRIGGLTSSGEVDKFESDIRVSLPEGESFGRYVDGDIILSNNKSAVDVIKMSIIKPLAPTITLDCNSVIKFNQNDISNILNFSYSINSIDISGRRAALSSVLLEYKRGNSDNWTFLSDDDNILYYPHIFSSVFTTNTFDYRLTVIDSQGGQNTVYKSITPVSYIKPTISIEVLAVTHSTPETNTKREKGNIASNINIEIIVNSPLAKIINYQLQYQVNGGSIWLNIGDLISVDTILPNLNISISHNDILLTNSDSIGYRVLVTDTSNQISDVVTVNFKNLIFYGVSSTTSISASEIRGLNKIFEDDTNSFTIFTGTQFKNFLFAIPSSLSLLSIIDEDTGVNYSDQYINTSINILDYGNISTPYKLYKMSLGIPYYPDGHRHNIITQINESIIVEPEITTTSISIEVLAVTYSVPETNIKREKGNIASNINIEIIKNSSLIELVSYQVQYQINGIWINIGSIVNISGSMITETILHNDISLVNSNSISYRVLVTDTTSQVKISDVITINFNNLIFYGASSISPLLSVNVRSLPNRIFSDSSDSFTIFTGTQFKNFSFAIPSSLSLSSIIDEDTGVNYTDLYTSTSIDILDYGNNSKTYKLYKMSLGIPYYPNEHRHVILLD